MLNECSRKTFASRSWLGTYVDKVPGVIVIVSKDLFLCVVQERYELIEEALPALFGQLPLHLEHSAPDYRADAIYVFTWRHPATVSIFYSLILSGNSHGSP